MARPPGHLWKTRESAAARAEQLFGSEIWAAIQQVRAGQWWASGWRGIAQGYDAEEQVADLLEQALDPLREARQVANRARLRFSVGRDDEFVAMPASLNTLGRKVEQLVADVENTAASTRQRVKRERERDDFGAQRFRNAEGWPVVEKSRARFIHAVLDKVPSAEGGPARWAYSAIALGLAAECATAGEFEALTRDWGSELRRVRSVRTRRGFPR